MKIYWEHNLMVSHDNEGFPVITLHNYHLTRWYKLRDKKDAMQLVKGVFGHPTSVAFPTSKETYGKYKIEMWRWLGETVGYNFVTSFNKMMYREWVVPYHELALKLCYRQTGFKSNELYYLWKYRELLEQCVRDGIIHITPLVHVFGKSPKELKSAVGNAAWKHIANASFGRNKLIARHNLGIIPSVVDLPSHILEMSSPYQEPSPVVKKRVKELKTGRELTKMTPSEYANIEFMYRDTKRMAQQTRQTFNENWGLTRLIEEHDRMTELINARMYSDEPFICVPCGPETVVGKKYKMVYLDTEKKIRDEGVAMGHCVGSYAQIAARGDCSIYSVRDINNDRVSTVEVRPYGLLVQHYGRFNVLPHEDVQQFVRETLEGYVARRRELRQ